MHQSRQNLVFVRVGKNSLHRDWLTGDGDRNWDLQLSQYDDDPHVGKGGDLPLSVDKGTKWDSVYRYLRANPEVMDRYRYIAFMDDDLVFSKADLNRYFDICAEHDLYLAQPSLHHRSYFCYPILLRCNLTKLRYTNFVECMAAAISTEYLKTFVPRMASIKSGWGMDRIWTFTMPDPAYRSAIIDEISMVHTRPHATGGIYKQFDRNALTPSAEMERLIRSYEGIPDKMLIYGGIDRRNRPIGATGAQILNGLTLVAGSWRYRYPMAALRSGLGMLVRAATQADYRPTPARLTTSEAM